MVTRAIAVAILALIATGCKTIPRQPYFEDLVSCWGILVEHHEICAFATPKQGVGREAVASFLLRYLEGRPRSRGFRYLPPTWHLGTRHRDFAAACLAGIRKVPLHIYTWQSEAEKDRAIEDFLKRVRQRPGPDR